MSAITSSPSTTRRAVDTYVVAAAAASSAVALWSLIQRTARKRARALEENAQRVLVGGPMLDRYDPNDTIKKRILKMAAERAADVARLVNPEDIKQMKGQVGGLNAKKRPVLSSDPDYILKPLLPDHRGFREVGFYEALALASEFPPSTPGGSESDERAGVTDWSTICSLSLLKTNGGTSSEYITPYCKLFEHGGAEERETWSESVAILLSFLAGDPVVVRSIRTQERAWLEIEREIDLLQRLSTFTAGYHGVYDVGATKFPVEYSPYLWLNDVTASFEKPCAIDIKMGRNTAEPTAPEHKKNREATKYPPQLEFGFRIVGMRVFDPTHAEADAAGYRNFDKQFGFSIQSADEMKEGLRTFFRFTQGGVEARLSQMISNFIIELSKLKLWMDDNASFAFFSSSIFLVYEGLSTGEAVPATKLKMIDFAHVCRQKGGDVGYVHGLVKLLGMMEDIKRER